MVALPVRKPKIVVRRGGTFDLLLVVLVVGAAWLRTPVGGIFDRGVQYLRGTDEELPPLISYFVTGPPPEIVVLAEQIAMMPAVVAPAPVDGFPEPWRTAARLTLSGDLPPAAEALAATMPDLPAEDRAVAILDRIYAGDAEAALETFAIGDAQRSRAVDRARSAGEADPNAFAVHRVYLPDDAARSADRIVSGTLALATVLDLTWPIVAPHRITSPYGERMHPTLKKKKFHDGVDLAVPTGTSVLAAQAGKVARAGEDPASGKFVVVDHGNGVRTSYCHLSDHSVAKGDAVLPGQQVGLSGNTGRSTGPHLHFTVRVGRGTVDPVRLRRDPVALGSGAAAGG